MKRWQFWVGLVISGVFLWAALRGLHLRAVWDVVRQADYWWLIPGVGAYFLAVWARAWRWHYLLKPIKEVSTATAFPIVTIGYMGNNIFPFRAGELLRSYVLQRNEAVPMSASLATIVVERAFDGLVMLSFVIFNLPELARATSDSGLVGDLRTVVIVGIAVFLGVVLLFLAMAMRPELAERIMGGLIHTVVPSGMRPRAESIAQQFVIGLTSLSSGGQVFMVLISSVVIWLLETAKYWFVMQAFPFEVSFYALMLMNGVVNLATTLPSAPGYIGTFDAPGIAVLVAYGVPAAEAAAYTLVLHAALWLPITLLGGYYFIRESVSWRTVQAELNPPVQV